MTKRWVLYALHRVIEDQRREAGIQALKGCNPLSASGAKRKLSVQLYRAEQESGSDDVAHLARLASFNLVKQSFSANFDDVAALKLEYDERFKKPLRPKAGPWVMGAGQ